MTTAIVTGAGRGIGAASARALARKGHTVVMAARSRDELEEVAASIRANGGPPPRVFPADMADADAVDALFDFASEEVGPVDVFVPCAATLTVRDAVEVTPELFQHHLDVNVRAVWQGCQRAFGQMAGRGGSIVTFSSLGGIRSTEKFPGMAPYCITKAAIVGLTESLAVEGKPHGIRVNCIAPGAVDTRMLREAAPHLRTETTPEDIARLVVFLADPEASGSLNGSVMEVFSNA